VTAGIRNAREKGRRFGRPRVEADLDEIRRLRAAGHSFRKIAVKVGIGEATVRERLKDQRGKPQEISPRKPSISDS
jgi:DNA invertase Pin-like site-specific DNA recombinase